MVLETAELDYQVFENVKFFLESYVSGTPGCLVLVISISGMQGDDLQAEHICRMIRLPIIFLSSYGDLPPSTSDRSFKAGAVTYMSKPVQIELLIERIQAVLQHEIWKYPKIYGTVFVLLTFIAQVSE
jgi:FixJ family two-component response regulator